MPAWWETLSRRPNRHSLPSSAVTRPSCPVHRAESSCWETTPITTAAWSCRPPLTGERLWSPAAPPGREARVFSVNLSESDTYSLDAIDQPPAGSLDPVCPRRLLGLDRLVRTAFLGLRGDDRRQCSVGSRALELGQPSGSTRLVSHSARPGSRQVEPETSSLTTLICCTWSWPGCCADRKTSLSVSAQDCSTSFPACSAVPATLCFSTATRWSTIDCPSADPPPAIVVCDSKTSRRLADGMYDQRRAECERVAAAFTDQIPHRGEFRLSWVSLEQLEAAWT